MKYYDSKNWILGLLRFDKNDTLRLLKKPILVMTFYSSLVAVLEIEVFKVGQSSGLKNVAMIHSTLGFVLSLLLVFRTNTAYDRWWEGRKLWGTLLNNSRNLAMKFNAFLPTSDTENREFFRKNISLFPFILMRHLSQDDTKFALDDDYFNENMLASKNAHFPLALVNRINSRCAMLYKEGKISDAQMRYIEREITAYMEVCGGCERIKNTPIPFSYASFIKRFIVTYVVALPISYAMTIGYAMVPLTVFVFYVLMSLELLAEEIEDPFNNDTNDVPMLRICENIKKNVEEVLPIQETSSV